MTIYQKFQDHVGGISTIDASFVRPQHIASHLLVENNHAVFIDVGVNSSVPQLLAALQAKNIPLENVDYVIVTHIHLDHAGSAGNLMQLLPNAQLVVHPRGARHLIDPTVLVAGATAVYGEEVFKECYGEIVPVALDRVIEAGAHFVLNFQGRVLLFLDTPGHARHHFCVFDERTQSFFTGDTFGFSYREFDSPQGCFLFATTTPVQFDPEAWHHSIEHLLSYRPKTMYLAHYGVVSEVNKLADKLHESIDKTVLLMKQVSSYEPEYWYQLLYEGIMNICLEELQQLNCSVPVETCRELLAGDVGLNAQGVAYWWEHVR
jgi:glyoxylase-like metal-dependent hydrolase (beta-lactamase superfamily II)